MAVRVARQGAVGSRCAGHDGQRRIAGSRWRSRGMACARSACPRSRWPPFPTSFARAWRPVPDILGDTGPDAPEHWVGGLAGDDLHAIAILFSRTDEQYRRSIEEHDKLLARTDGVRSLSHPRPQRDAPVQLRPRPLRLPRSAVAAGDEGFRRGADPGLRCSAGARRVHPRLSRRRRSGRQSS